jgi:hypothetical protein
MEGVGHGDEVAALDRDDEGFVAARFVEFRVPVPGIGSPETDPKSRKPAISGLFSHYLSGIPSALHCLAGAGGFEL